MLQKWLRVKSNPGYSQNSFEKKLFVLHATTALDLVAGWSIGSGTLDVRHTSGWVRLPVGSLSSGYYLTVDYLWIHWYITKHQGQLSLPSLRVGKSSTGLLGWG